jgi:hypothetical protein
MVATSWHCAVGGLRLMRKFEFGSFEKKEILLMGSNL